MEVKEFTFLEECLQGLKQQPKTLPSKYFYDEKGDVLFQKIMQQPEYYLTRTEMSILQEYKAAMVSQIKSANGVRIVELGAGDGSKSAHLVKAMLKADRDVIYSPIDISANVLEQLEANFQQLVPDAVVESIVCDYNLLKEKLPKYHRKKWMLFLGSNLGNYSREEAKSLMSNFTSCLSEGEYFMLGVDLVKSPERILAAYNDAQGVTAAFNLNLLERMNRELGADFDLEAFSHYPIYNPWTQQAESYLVSRKKQTVYFKEAEESITFEAWEPIHTEISRKFTLTEIHEMAARFGFEVVEDFMDEGQDYCCSLWRKV